MKLNEAKEMICPFTIQFGGQPFGFNLEGGMKDYTGLFIGDVQGCCCITDKCMAWVFEVEEWTGKFNQTPTKISTTNGFCKRL
jgi:hypothetical protein